MTEKNKTLLCGYAIGAATGIGIVFLLDAIAWVVL